MNQTNIKNRKVYLMDTSTFTEFLDNDNSHYDIVRLKHLIDRDTLFVITPYTLYEYLLKTKDESIKSVCDKIAFNTDFFVLNVNHIFEDYEGYLDGRSFVFRFRMHEDDIIVFEKALEIFKEKVYKTLAPKLYLISQIIAIFWLIFSESFDDGTYNQDTRFKIKYIDEHFLNQHKKRYDLLLRLEFEKSDIKYRIADIITSLAFEMIGLANVEMFLWKNSLKVDGNEYNKMIIEELNRFEPIFCGCSLHKVYTTFLKRTGKKYSFDYLEDWALKRMNFNLLKDSFKAIIKKAFSKEGLHRKETNNDIIDFTNMCLIEDFAGIPVAFLTSEKKWLKYILKNNDVSLKKTKETIKNYINPDYFTIINR